MKLLNNRSGFRFTDLVNKASVWVKFLSQVVFIKYSVFLRLCQQQKECRDCGKERTRSGRTRRRHLSHECCMCTGAVCKSNKCVFFMVFFSFSWITCWLRTKWHHVMVFPSYIENTCKPHPLSFGINVSVNDCLLKPYDELLSRPSCFPAFCSVCAGIVSVTLNNNKGVDELFIIYCSFSHLIEAAMYRLEHILGVTCRLRREWWDFPLAKVHVSYVLGWQVKTSGIFVYPLPYVSCWIVCQIGSEWNETSQLCAKKQAV